MDLLEKLGVDWRLLTGQLVNFLIVFLVLKKFVYKPLLAALERRRRHVEEGVRSADEAKKLRAAAEEECVHILKTVHSEASAIVAKAKESAHAVIAQARAQAEGEAAQIVAQAKRAAVAEERRVIQDATQHISSLAVHVAEAILKEELKGKREEEWILSLVKDIRAPAHSNRV